MGGREWVLPRDIQACDGIGKLGEPVSCVGFALAVHVWIAGSCVWRTVRGIASMHCSSLWLGGDFVRHLSKLSFLHSHELASVMASEVKLLGDSTLKGGS